MNTVKDLIYDVRHRIGDLDRNPIEILRVMNREYTRLNRERKCVILTLALPAGTFSSTVNTYAIPAGFVKLMNLVPSDTWKYTLTFIPPERWNPNAYAYQDVFTMLAGSFVFGNVDDSAAMTLYLLTTGKTLVHAEDVEIASPAPSGGYLTDNYTNTPEWPTDLHELLVIETAMSMVPEYPMMRRDAEKRGDLLAALSRHGRAREQAITQQRIGGVGTMQPNRDPDYVDGQWVTRE